MADMQRRHYEFIAETLKARQPEVIAHEEDNIRWAHWLELVCSFAYRLDQTNTNFNRQRFLKACGLDS